jgi:hypothetical protein
MEASKYQTMASRIDLGGRDLSPERFSPDRPAAIWGLRNQINVVA